MENQTAEQRKLEQQHFDKLLKQTLKTSKYCSWCREWTDHIKANCPKLEH